MIYPYNVPYLGSASAANDAPLAGAGAGGGSVESPTRPPYVDLAFGPLNNAWHWLSGKLDRALSDTDPADSQSEAKGETADNAGDTPIVDANNGALLSLALIGGAVALAFFLRR